VLPARTGCDLDEADLAAGRCQIVGREALGDPLGGPAERGARIVVEALPAADDPRQAVAKRRPPAAATIPGIDVQVHGDDAQRGPPLGKSAGVLDAGLVHLASPTRRRAARIAARGELLRP
jgi:hypothetical protein